MKKIKQTKKRGLWRGYENGRWVLEFTSKASAEEWLNRPPETKERTHTHGR